MKILLGICVRCIHTVPKVTEKRYLPVSFGTMNWIFSDHQTFKNVTPSSGIILKTTGAGTGSLNLQVDNSNKNVL